MADRRAKQGRDRDFWVWVWVFLLRFREKEKKKGFFCFEIAKGFSASIPFHNDTQSQLHTGLASKGETMVVEWQIGERSRAEIAIFGFGFFCFDSEIVTLRVWGLGEK